MGPIKRRSMALIFPQDQFQHILRVLNTNVDGRQKIPFAITAIRGVGRRFANMVCKKAEVDLNKRAGELTSEEIDKIVAVIQNPLQFMPAWFVNRKKDIKDGKMRESLERLWKCRCHRGLRHGWGLRVRGQKTCTTGRHGKTVGVARKKGQ